MNNAQLINQSTGNVEWYTPAHIIEAARGAMGSIDLDPASSDIANQTVKAAIHYSHANGIDGLSNTWNGNVWVNHPFGRKTNKPWVDKIISEYTANHGMVKSICCITFASTSEKWFQPLLNYPICFLSPRVNYVGPDGQPVKGVTKGSCVTYLGPNTLRFADVFGELGKVMFPR